MKKFFAEFKKFITRGNVMDLAVGVIIGGAFTAIVNALTNNILMPLVNYVIKLITGGNGMEGAVTFLDKVTDEAGVVDMAKSIYIDWGAFIVAIINFLLIALVLFCIVKAINGLHDAATAGKYGYTKKEYRDLRRSGKTDAEVKALADERDALAAKKAEEEAAEAARKAAEPSSTDKLLAEILETLKNK